MGSSLDTKRLAPEDCFGVCGRDEELYQNKEFESLRKWAPEQCEITGKDFSDPVHEAMNVFP